MPRINDMFPSRYLKAADLGENDMILTIADVVSERIGQGNDADDKWVLMFKETKKGLVLNKTNAGVLCKLFGDDTDFWVDRRISLFATEVQFKQEMVEAIRVRSKLPFEKGKKQPTAPTTTIEAAEESDEVPF